jgi:hypothetical protein
MMGTLVPDNVQNRRFHSPSTQEKTEPSAIITQSRSSSCIRTISDLFAVKLRAARAQNHARLKHSLSYPRAYLRHPASPNALHPHRHHEQTLHTLNPSSALSRLTTLTTQWFPSCTYLIPTQLATKG